LQRCDGRRLARRVVRNRRQRTALHGDRRDRRRLHLRARGGHAAAGAARPKHRPLAAPRAVAHGRIRGRALGALGRARDARAAAAGVARVAPPRRSGDLRLALVTLADDPETFAAHATYHRLVAAAGRDAVVGGATAYGIDVDHAVFGGLWKMLLFILAVSYVV